MADPQFHCNECHQDTPYYETRKGRDPRSTKFRIICGECIERIREPAASDFRVEANYRKAGPSQHAATAAAEHAKISDIHRHIWRHLKDSPATPGEVFKALSPVHGLKLNTYRARITDLKDLGWIEDSGDRRTTELESIATVWRAVA